MARATLFGLILIVAGILVYSRALEVPIVLDDQLTIFENPQIRDWRSLRVLFPERELPVAGRPLVNLSFALNYALGGTNLVGYRVINLALHLFCALAAFALVRRVLEVPKPKCQNPRPKSSIPKAKGKTKSGQNPRSGDDDSEPTVIAFAIALIWVLHPLNSEVIGYITQRTESMMALCYLLTLYASVRALDPSVSTRWQAAAVVTCAAGMACKESMASAPLMVMLFDRLFVFGSWRDAIRTRGRLYLALAATWALLAALLWSGPRIHSAGFAVGISPWTYLLNQAVMIVRYLELALWPHALVIQYGWPVQLTLGAVLPQALVVGALLAATIAAFAFRPRLAFAGAWFFVTLAPASSVIPIATEVGAERRMYLPLLALVTLAVIAVWEVLTRTVLTRADPPRRRLAAAVTLVIVATGLGATTYARTREYASTLTLAQTVMDRWPTPVAHHWLGEQLLLAGRTAEGVDHLRQAVAGAPRAHYNLGVELMNQGRLDEAVVELREFVQRQPLLLEVPEAHVLIANVFLKREQWGEAAAELRTALKMAPRHPHAWSFLAGALFKQEQLPEAIAAYQAHLRITPNDGDALTNLGIALVAAGQVDDAIVPFRRAAQINPRSADARRNFAMVLLDANLAGEAAREAREAVALRPDDPTAHDLLGQALAHQGQLTAARDAFAHALRLNPASAEVSSHLRQVETLLAAR